MTWNILLELFTVCCFDCLFSLRSIEYPYSHISFILQSYGLKIVQARQCRSIITAILKFLVE